MEPILAIIGKTHYPTTISRGAMQWKSDEPIPLGTDSGPTPYDLLLGALGGCIAMTLRMYVDRKGWEVDSIQVKLTQERVHTRDCEDCESANGFIHLIQKELFFKGNIDETQHRRLQEIANKCPVHKTLLNEIKIDTVASTLVE